VNVVRRAATAPLREQPILFRNDANSRTLASIAASGKASSHDHTGG
jgi:pyrroloquinoline quinone biosynthesis protein E